MITGVGIYSCIGKNINEVTSSLKMGKCGIGIDAIRTEMGYRSALTGIIDIPNLKGILPRRQRVSLSEEAIYAYRCRNRLPDSRGGNSWMICGARFASAEELHEHKQWCKEE